MCALHRGGRQREAARDALSLNAARCFASLPVQDALPRLAFLCLGKGEAGTCQGGDAEFQVTRGAEGTR